MRPTPDQHQQDKPAHKIKVHKTLFTRKPPIERARISPHDPEPDRQINVHRPDAQCPHGSREKINSTHQKTQRRKRQRQQPKQARIFERRLHPEINRKREQHHVHREGRAQADAFRQPATFRLRPRLTQRPHQIPKRLQHPRKRHAVEHSADPAPAHRPELRVGHDIARASLLGEQTLDQPHAPRTRHALQIQNQLGRTARFRRPQLRRALRRFQPSVITGLKHRRIRRHRNLILDPIITCQTLFVHETKDVTATRAAEARLHHPRID